jgi:hypothetical protein
MMAKLVEKRPPIFANGMIEPLECQRLDRRVIDETKVSRWGVPVPREFVTCGIVVRLTLARVVGACRRWVPGRNHKKSPRLEAFSIGSFFIVLGALIASAFLSHFNALRPNCGASWD